MENFAEGKMSFAQSANLIISNFNLSLHSYNQTINIDTLIKNFKVDVSLNENHTMLMQGNKPVSKNNLKMNTKEHKRMHYDRPLGFVQLQYAQERKSDPTVSIMDKYSLISNPPIGPILDGAWCPSCRNVGPKFHKMNCKDPNSLKFTLYGVIQYIYDTKKLESAPDLQESLNERIQFIRGLRGSLQRPDYIQAYQDVLRENSGLNRYSETSIPRQGDEWPLLNIDVDKKLSKGGGVFPNCVVIKYNFKESSVSVRIYDKGTIMLISCPWEEKNFTNIILERINDTRAVVDPDQVHNYEIDTSQTQIKSVFSIFRFTPVDLDSLFKYLWPLDNSGNPTDYGVKVTLTKHFESGETPDQVHSYLKTEYAIYRYEIKYDKKIILTLLPTVGDPLPKYCKPYKITAIIFKGGAVELIFSLAKDSDLSDSTEYIIPVDLEDQFKEIENELLAAKRFIEGLILPEFRRPANDDDVALINTVSGIFPYKKPLSYKPNTEVDIFDKDLMEFTGVGRVVEEAKPLRSTPKGVDAVYKVDGPSGPIELSEQLIRPNGKKISAMLLNDPPNNRPEPYGFRSKCPEGNNFIVPFGGKQGRDNYYYPVCKKATGPDRQLYLSHILNGFPAYASRTEENEFIISKTDKYDKFSGVFKAGAIKLFATIRFKLPPPELLEETSQEAIDYFEENKDDEGYMKGTIINFKKTTGKVLDNYVIYEVKMENSDTAKPYPSTQSVDTAKPYPSTHPSTQSVDTAMFITGKDIHPSYKESRVWGGIQGNDEMQKNQLIRCTEKLGLSQSPFTTSRLHRELEANVIKKLSDLIGTEDYFNPQTALTPQTLNKFTKRPYIGLLLPKGSKRVLFFLEEGGRAYLIDEKLAVMVVPVFDTEIKLGSCVLEGFAAAQSAIVEFYPVDCVYFKKKLTIDYWREGRDGSQDEFSDFLDDIYASRSDVPRHIENLLDNLKYGRLMYTILIASILNLPNISSVPRNTRKGVHFKNPQDYCVPSFKADTAEPYRRSASKDTAEPYLSNNSMIHDLAKLVGSRRSEFEILFIPQTGKSSNIRWMKLMNRPIVLMVTAEGRKNFTVGLEKKLFEPFGDSQVILKADMGRELMKKKPNERFMRFYLNFMSNGELNPEEKLLVDNINPYATSKDAESYEKTDLIIKALLYPIPVTMFQNDKYWKLVTNTPDHKKIFSIHLEPSPDSPGTSALISS